MKLYIKQKVFSLGDKYNILDENENLVYKVNSQLFAIAAKLQLMDGHDRELYYIKRKLTLFLAKYEIYQNGELYAVVSQRMAFLKSRIDVDSKYGQYEIDGNIINREYIIRKNGNLLGKVHKKWLSWGDSYELEIIDPDNASFFCALVVAIDNCIHNENK